VLKTLAHRLARVFGDVLGSASTALREASRPAARVLGLVTDLFRSRRLLLAESVLLRQQLLVVDRQIMRPSITAFDRANWRRQRPRNGKSVVSSRFHGI
jgi:hypothetical protein